MVLGFNLPLLVMLGQSFVGKAGFTLANFREVFEASAYLKVLGSTFRIALLSSTLALVLGGLAAYGLVRGRLFGRMAIQSNLSHP